MIGRTMLRRARERRLLRSLGRWNQANSPLAKTAVALTVIVMSFGLLTTL